MVILFFKNLLYKPDTDLSRNTIANKTEKIPALTVLTFRGKQLTNQ